jgi:large subunit ribosomal protein L4e
MTDTPVHALDGSESGTVELPDVFGEPYRPDLIRNAVAAARANRAQDYGSDEYAGLRTPAESHGSGRGMAHVPRQDGQGRRVPQTVSGRAAHPPKPEADRTKDLNDKERQAAIRSAVAATADADRVRERGHAFDGDLALPLVIDDAFEGLEKTQEALAACRALGVDADIERADERTIRAGRGTTRGRTYRRPTSVLFVTSSDAGPSRAARNLAGADVATAREVNAEDLAPGGDGGRLTVWTESAVAEVADR